MTAFLGVLTVASLIYASNPGPGADLPPPREVPSQSPAQPVPEPPSPPSGDQMDKQPAEENNKKTPPGGNEATLGAPTNGALATISGVGLEPVCFTCPKLPVTGPLTWTGLLPPSPPVADCRAGAWQQVYVPLVAGQTSNPPVAPSPPLRVGYPWYRCCHVTVCSQGIGNWKRPPSCLFCHCFYCNARCCGYGPGGCCKGPGAP